MMALINSQRDYGTMLVAERKTRVYEITDGGDGKGKIDSNASKKNQPSEDTPRRSWNLFVPVLLMVRD